jgi:hypothetical protein
MNLIDELKKVGKIQLNSEGGIIKNNSVTMTIRNKECWCDLTMGILSRKVPLFYMTGKLGHFGKRGQKLKPEGFGQVAENLNIPIVDYLHNFRLMSQEGNNLHQIENSWFWLSQFLERGTEQDKISFQQYFGNKILGDDPFLLFSEEDLGEIKRGSRIPIKEEWEPRRVLIQQKLKEITDQLGLVWG